MLFWSVRFGPGSKMGRVPAFRGKEKMGHRKLVCRQGFALPYQHICWRTLGEWGRKILENRGPTARKLPEENIRGIVITSVG